MSRGEYRSIHTVLVEDTDFQSLDPDAKLVWYTLKMQLGPSGLGTITAWHAVLGQQTGLSPDRLQEALDELVEEDWLRAQDNIFWIVNGLRYDPSVTVSNDKHAKSVQKHLSSLPKRAIVNAFAEEHDGLSQPWPEVGTGYPHDTPTVPHAVHGNGRRKTETEDGEVTEGSSLRSSPSGASADSDPDPEADQMDADQLLEAGKGAIAARYLPPTREWLFLDSDPPRKAETKAVSVYTQWLEKGYGADNLDLFPRGFRHLIDNREVVWVEVGDPCGPWAAYNQKIGAQSAFMAAVEAGRKLEGQSAPDERVLELAEGVSV